MKSIISVCAMAVVLSLAAGLLWAQEAAKVEGAEGKVTAPGVKTAAEQAADPRTFRPKRTDMRELREPGPARTAPRSMPPELNRGMMQQQQLKVMQDQIAKKRQDFEQYAAELKAIRKMALEEKAKKTADYIDKLLERKEGELAAEVKVSEDRLKQVQEQMENLAKERSQRLERARRGQPDPAAAQPGTAVAQPPKVEKENK